MYECICGFSAGTDAAFQRHCSRARALPGEMHRCVSTGQEQPASSWPQPSSTSSSSSSFSPSSGCPHLGACDCSRFRVLGVAPSASPGQIREAFKALSLRFHPDRRPAGLTVAQATEKFAVVRAAYDVLMRRAEQRGASSAAATGCTPLDDPLLAAARDGDVEAVRARLASGDDDAALDSLDEDGMDALAWACRRGHTEVIAELLRHHQRHGEARGDDADRSLVVERTPPLVAAAASGSAAAVELLLGKGGGGGGGGGGSGGGGGGRGGGGGDGGALEEKDSLLGHASLHVASDKGHAAVVTRLLQANASVATVDRRGYAPLSVASFRGHVAVVTLLLDANAAIDVRAEGDTPLALAARRGKADVVALLLARGAVAEPRCEAQARAKGHVELAEELARARARQSAVK